MVKLAGHRQMILPPTSIWRQGLRVSIGLLTQAVQEFLVLCRPRGKPLPSRGGPSTTFWVLYFIESSILIHQVRSSVQKPQVFKYELEPNQLTKEMWSTVKLGFFGVWSIASVGRSNGGTAPGKSTSSILWNVQTFQSQILPLVAAQVVWLPYRFDSKTTYVYHLHIFMFDQWHTFTYKRISSWSTLSTPLSLPRFFLDFG